MFDLIWILDRNLFGLLARFQSGEGGGEKEHKEARRDKEIFQRSRRQFLPLPKPRPEDDGAFNLFIGEACDIETGYSAEEFIYLPERGLFTNTIVFGSVGSAKTAGLLYPLLRQMIDYAQDDPSERIGGLIFDAKDDFSRQARSFLEEAGRGDDFVYLTIDGDYILNPVNDPDMPGMVTASLIASLNDQVIGKSKEGFWKGSYIQLLQQLVTGCQVGFDYTNLIYLPAFASDIDTGARIVNYISHLCGAHGEQEGTLLVYRNLLTNTDTPWEYDQEHRERKLVNVAGNLSLRAAANPDDSYQAFVEACSSVRLEQDTLANALQVCFEREEGLPESYEIERAALNEVHANVYPVFSATFLNPYSRDKAAAIEAVCDLFGISGNYESVKNPFEGRLDPFTHDYYNYKLTYIHLTRYEDTQLLRALLQRCSVHYLPIDTDRIQRAEVFFTW